MSDRAQEEGPAALAVGTIRVEGASHALAHRLPRALAEALAGAPLSAADIARLRIDLPADSSPAALAA
ncbi:MAG: hypothetical protein SNJ63_07235, partial [Sphingomonadaceae bacterium]